MSELERAAGVPLVVRTTRSVSLTAAGQQLVAETEQPLRASNRALPPCATWPARRAGWCASPRQWRWGASTSRAVARGRSFCRSPRSASSSISPTASSIWRRKGFDLAIRHVQAPPDTHVAWTLCDTRSLLVASPAYLARRGMPTHPRDLAAHDCLLYLRPGAARTGRSSAWPGGAVASR